MGKEQIIPHTYSDKVELIKDFLFASIVDFIENEPIEFTDWEIIRNSQRCIS